GVRVRGRERDGPLIGRRGAGQVARAQGRVAGLEQAIRFACRRRVRSWIAARHLAQATATGAPVLFPGGRPAGTIAGGNRRNMFSELKNLDLFAPGTKAWLFSITRLCPDFDGFDTFRPFRHSSKRKAINNTNHKVASLGGTNRHLASEI